LSIRPGPAQVCRARRVCRTAAGGICLAPAASTGNGSLGARFGGPHALTIHLVLGGGDTAGLVPPGDRGGCTSSVPGTVPGGGHPGSGADLWLLVAVTPRRSSCLPTREGCARARSRVYGYQFWYSRALAGGERYPLGRHHEDPDR